MNKLAHHLLNDADSQVVNAAVIENDLSELNNSFEAVHDELEREENKLGNVIDNMETFQGALNQFESWLPEAMMAVQSFKPISSEPEEIKRQLKEVEVSCFLVSKTITTTIITFFYLVPISKKKTVKTMDFPCQADMPDSYI